MKCQADIGDTPKRWQDERTHVSVSEVADVALERDGLPGDGGDVPAGVLEEGRVLLEDGLVVSEVLELT